MTHNSYAAPGDVLFPNQNNREPQQFRDGIRGFALDVYEEAGGRIMMKHHPDGIRGPTVDYFNSVRNLVSVIRESGNGNEFVLVQFQDEVRSEPALQRVVEPWGDLVITNFDIEKPLGYYITQGKRVLLTTDVDWHHRPDMGLHRSTDLIAENDFAWYNVLAGPPMSYRRGPFGGNQRYAKMLNFFCTAGGIGNTVTSSTVNTEVRMKTHARQFMRQSYAQNTINIIMVDFYDTGGDVFQVQESIRNGDFGQHDCWRDGSRCVAGDSCFNCCNDYEWWDSKFFFACGEEKCWRNGRVCGAGTTCNNCCNGRSCPWYQFGVCTCN